MEAYRIVAGAFAVQSRTDRVGLVLETDVMAGGVLIKWQDTGDEELIPAHTILRTYHRPKTDQKHTSAT